MDGAVKRIHSAPAWVSSQNHQRGTSSSSWRRTGVGWTAMFCVSWLAWTPPNLSTRSAASSFLTICLMTPSQFSSLLSETQVCTILWYIYFYFPFQNQQFKKNYSFFFLENYFYHTQISALLNTSTCVLHCKMCFLQSFNSLELKLDLWMILMLKSYFPFFRNHWWQILGEVKNQEAQPATLQHRYVPVLSVKWPVCGCLCQL